MIRSRCMNGSYPIGPLAHRQGPVTGLAPAAVQPSMTMLFSGPRGLSEVSSKGGKVAPPRCSTGFCIRKAPFFPMPPSVGGPGPSAGLGTSIPFSSACSSPSSLTLHAPLLGETSVPRTHSGSAWTLCCQQWWCWGSPFLSRSSRPDVSQNSELFRTEKGHVWPVPRMRSRFQLPNRRQSAGNRCVHAPSSCLRSGQVWSLNVTVANLGQIFWFSELLRTMDKGRRACLFPFWVRLKVPSWMPLFWGEGESRIFILH